MVEYILVIGLVAVSVGFWLRHLTQYDVVRPEPLAELLRVGLLGGILAAVVAGLINAAFQKCTGIRVLQDVLPPGQTMLVATFIGLNEETVKFLVVAGLTWRLREIDEPLDVLIYAGCVALGFATVENIDYTRQYGLGALVLRNVTAVPLHVGVSSVWGLTLAQARFGLTRFPVTSCLTNLVAGIAVHALYDFCTLSLGHEAVYLSQVSSMLIGYILIRRMSWRMRHMATLSTARSWGDITQ